MEGTIYIGKNNKSENAPTEPNPEILEESYKTLSSIQGGSLSKPVRRYIQEFKDAVAKEKERITDPIIVDELASKIAKFYEKIRRVIDWKEEHLMRRTVIERILKRRLISEISGISLLPDLDAEQIAEPVVLELVRSGYFRNGSIHKDKILDVQKLLDKYIYILRNSVENNGNGDGTKKKKRSGIKKKINFYNWIMEIASCEIEEILDPPLKVDALINLMTSCLYERIKLIPEGKLSGEEKYIQTYIAVHRTLFNLDEPITVYHLIRHKYPDFINDPEKMLPRFADDLLSIWEGIEKDINYRGASEFYKIGEKYDAPYLMLGDVFGRFEDDLESIEEKLLDKTTLKGLVQDAYEKRLKTLKARLFRSAIYSTLSIFVAGGASLFLFEVPIAKWIHGNWSPWALVADIAIPTSLMFILVWGIKPPSGDNLERIKEEVDKIVYLSDKTDIYDLRLVKKIKRFFNFLFAIVYLAGGFVALYSIYWVFKIADVPWTSLYINTANVALVVFAAMVIRQRAKELTIEEKDNFVEFILDFFSIPLAKIGLWLSNKWKEYNIVSVFFATLIDIPFSGFLETIEGWRSFIKEKRSEIH